jgi:hypothetical protein
MFHIKYYLIKSSLLFFKKDIQNICFNENKKYHGSNVFLSVPSLKKHYKLELSNKTYKLVEKQYNDEYTTHPYVELLNNSDINNYNKNNLFNLILKPIIRS